MKVPVINTFNELSIMVEGGDISLDIYITEELSEALTMKNGIITKGLTFVLEDKEYEFNILGIREVS